MQLLADITIAWPAWLVHVIRGFRNFCAWCSEHTVIGIPRDWPLRFVVLAAMYGFLRRWLSARRTAAITIAILLGKEIFDIVAHEDLRPRAPNWGDAADILSGLAGIALAAWLVERRGWFRRPDRRTSTPPPA